MGEELPPGIVWSEAKGEPSGPAQAVISASLCPLRSAAVLAETSRPPRHPSPGRRLSTAGSLHTLPIAQSPVRPKFFPNT